MDNIRAISVGNGVSNVFSLKCRKDAIHGRDLPVVRPHTLLKNIVEMSIQIRMPGRKRLLRPRLTTKIQ